MERVKHCIFLDQKLTNKALTIVGNGEQTSDFIHVKDLVRAILKAASSKKSNKLTNDTDGFVLIGEAEILSKICNGIFLEVEKQCSQKCRSPYSATLSLQFLFHVWYFR